MIARILRSAAVASAFCLVACGPHLGSLDDAAADAPPLDATIPAPVLHPLPSLAPYWVAPLRGSAPGADRVEIARVGADDAGLVDPVFATPDVDGTFCEQMLLPGPGSYTFVAYAINAGVMSPASNRVSTTFSLSAPPVPTEATCAGGPPSACDATGNCCTARCGAHTCGPDGCGGSCGTCASPQTCAPSTQTCCPRTCGTTHNCGPDGCGGTCGTCPVAVGSLCAAGVCCMQNCAGRNCGTDGCGGNCGSCVGTAVCSAAGVCVAHGCAQDTDCVSCAGERAELCGWCESTARCLPGGSTMSTDGTCTGANWRFITTQCP